MQSDYVWKMNQCYTEMQCEGQMGIFVVVGE